MDSWLIALLVACFLTSAGTVGMVIRVKPELTVQFLVFLGTAWLTTAAVTWPMVYMVDGDHLVVRSGLITWRIPVRSIQSVTPTRNPTSAPAWSLDRLQIVYMKSGRSEQLFVSPVDQGGFLSDLSAADPNLHIHGDHMVRRGFDGL